MSPIADFYADQTIFLTGGTGFLGKVLLRKLTKTCPNIKKIYILIRPKENTTPRERLNNIFDCPLFAALKSSSPSALLKLVPVEGDSSLPFLGLSPQDQTLLKNEVSCVIHAAANVRFDADLRTSVYTNVRSLRDLLHIANDMKKLKAFVYVSTAFSHCERSTIDEEFYDVDIEPDKLIRMVEVMNDQLIDIVTPHILGKWPNTYVFTKAVAEEIIRSFKTELPIAISRPAIVISTYEDPIPGWISGFHGVIGIIIGCALGVIRTLPADRSTIARIVPVDYVANNLIAIPWNIEKNQKSIKIYNFMGSNQNTVSWRQMHEILKSFTFKYPLSAAIWYRFVVMAPNIVAHKIRIFFLHILFAYLVDAILIITRRKPLAVQKYRRINKLIGLLTFFTKNSWHFENKNVEELWNNLDKCDKKTFKFDMSDFDYRNYFDRCALGGRLYLLNDSIETIPAARRKMYFLCGIHYMFCLLLMFCFYNWFLSPVFNCFY